MELTVNTVTARTQAQRPGLRPRLEAALASASFELPGRPSTILLIRSIADPMPGRWSRDGGGPGLSPRWEHALAERIASAHASAHRGTRGVIDPDAGSVVFTDRAEMLACWLRDSQEAGRREHWWWHCVRRALGLGGGRVSGALLAHPREAPAVFAYLAEQGAAESVAAALSAGELAEVAAAALDAFDAGRLAAPALELLSARHGVRRLSDEGSVSATEAPRPGSSEDRYTTATHPTSPARAPGSPEVPADASRPIQQGLPPSLTPAFEVFLALMELLGSAPAWVRSASAAMLRERLQSASARRGADRRAVTPPAAFVPGAHDTAASAAAPVTPAPTRSIASGTAGNMARDAAYDPVEAAGTAFAPRSRRAAERPPAQAGDEHGLPGSEVNDPTRLHAPSQRTHLSSSGERRPSPVAAVEAGFAGQHGFRTEYAGALYLLNLTAAFEGYEGSCDHWLITRGTGPWALLSVLARRLLRLAGVRPGGDPVWAALAGLAHASDEAIGRRRSDAASGPVQSTDPWSYRLPLSWHARLVGDGDRALWCRGPDRLRGELWSSRGYLLARMSGADQSSVSALAGAYGLAVAPDPVVPSSVRERWSLHRDREPDVSVDDTAFSVWVEGTALALAALLATRLEMGDRREAIRHALQVAGEVTVTRTHVDVVLPLQAADGRTRRAGLDQDPGWCPAYGRIVKFHFNGQG